MPTSNFSSNPTTAAWPEDAGRNWFQMGRATQDGLNCQRPPVFSSLKELGRVVLGIRKDTDPLASSPSPHPPLPQNQENPRSTVEDDADEAAIRTAAMAFLNVDQAPLMFPGFPRVLVQGRPKFTRVVNPRTAPTNKDLAIVTVSNFPLVRFHSQRSRQPLWV